VLVMPTPRRATYHSKAASWRRKFFRDSCSIRNSSLGYSIVHSALGEQR
jgi:hypothetical protein